MNWWILGGVVVGVPVLGYLAQRFGLIDLRGTGRTGSASNGVGLMGIGDEVFAPARHEAALELDRQTILPAPAPVAGDPLRAGIDADRPGEATTGASRFDGRMKIDLRTVEPKQSNDP